MTGNEIISSFFHSNQFSKEEEDPHQNGVVKLITSFLLLRKTARLSQFSVL